MCREDDPTAFFAVQVDEFSHFLKAILRSLQKVGSKLVEISCTLCSAFVPLPDSIGNILIQLA